jgi:hypothetical protein
VEIGEITEIKGDIEDYFDKERVIKMWFVGFLFRGPMSYV